jgi:phosphohistidine phosphatase
MNDMKILYLVRHAKSSWEDQAFDDFDRPLKSVGVKDAYLMGSYLKSKGIVPRAIISSPAARAINTAVVFASRMDYPFSEIQLNKNIYESSAADILQAICHSNIQEDSIMIFGHDPSLSNLFMLLTGIQIEKIPTAGVAAIEIEITDWKAIKSAKGKLMFLKKPKDIRADI